MKYLSKIVLTILLFNSFVNTIYWYDLTNLNWSKAKKNYCASNVVKAIWLNHRWDAYTYTSHIDKRENPEVWEIVVINRYTKNFQWKWTMWYKYWHLAIITEVDSINKQVKTTDWIYTIRIKQNIVAWYISVNKMIEMWATNIKIEELSN